MRTLLRAAALVAIVLATTVGCSGGDDNLVRPGIKETREDKLPDGFPKNLPLPEGSSVIVSGDLTGGVELVLFRAESPEGGFRGFFIDELPDEGWVLASCAQTDASPEPVSLIVATKGREQVNITAGYLDVDYPIAYQGEYSFAVQHWKTEQPAATPEALPENCR